MARPSRDRRGAVSTSSWSGDTLSTPAQGAPWLWGPWLRASGGLTARALHPLHGPSCPVCPPSASLGGPRLLRGGDHLCLVLPGRPRVYRGMTGLVRGKPPAAASEKSRQQDAERSGVGETRTRLAAQHDCWEEPGPPRTGPCGRKCRGDVGGPRCPPRQALTGWPGCPQVRRTDIPASVQPGKPESDPLSPNFLVISHLEYLLKNKRMTFYN